MSSMTSLPPAKHMPSSIGSAPATHRHGPVPGRQRSCACTPGPQPPGGILPTKAPQSSDQRPALPLPAAVTHQTVTLPAKSAAAATKRLSRMGAPSQQDTCQGAGLSVRQAGMVHGGQSP